MKYIHVPGGEFYDESTNQFFEIKPQTLQLEHSLVSISKWEQKWHKAFFGKKEKTKEEVLDYIKCMTITQNVDPLVFLNVNSQEILKEIIEYIEDPMSATYFNDNKRTPPGQDTVTSELIYYWMISLNSHILRIAEEQTVQVV